MRTSRPTLQRALAAGVMTSLLAAILLAQPSGPTPQPLPHDPKPISPSPIDETPPRRPQYPGLTSVAKAPKLLAIKLHADWCPDCKAMGTLFEDLGKKFDAEPILFLKLDLTDQHGRMQGEYMVSALGLGSQWKDLGEGKKTGQIVLVDPATHRIVKTIAHDAGWEAAAKMIEEAVKK